MKHRITIKVSNASGKEQTVLRGADMKLPRKIARLLFGDFTQVYLLAPGQTVQAVDIKEIQEEKV